MLWNLGLTEDAEFWLTVVVIIMATYVLMYGVTFVLTLVKCVVGWAFDELKEMVCKLVDLVRNLKAREDAENVGHLTEA